MKSVGEFLSRAGYAEYVPMYEHPCEENGYNRINFTCHPAVRGIAEYLFFDELKAMNLPVRLVRKMYVGHYDDAGQAEEMSFSTPRIDWKNRPLN